MLNTFPPRPPSNSQVCLYPTIVGDVHACVQQCIVGCPGQTECYAFTYNAFTGECFLRSKSYAINYSNAPFDSEYFYLGVRADSCDAGASAVPNWGE